MRRWFSSAGAALPLALFAGLLAPTLAPAETCMSPFVKRLDRPEKYLYVFCVDADARDNDFLAVIDVDAESARYGQVLYQLDLGSAGNETHHFGYTDDRSHIWGCSLFSNRIFVINVSDDPARPKLVKSFDSSEKTGFTGPHSPYALPGRMLISYLGGKDGGLPAGLAEFDNDGTFIRKLDMPREAPYGYDVAINPDRNRMVTSSFTPPENYRKPLAKMDMKRFGDKLVVWDFRDRKPLQTLTTGAAPLECRWSLKEGADHGFANCAFDDSIWVWEGDGQGAYGARKLCETGKLPVDLSQSPDGKYLYVSCFAVRRGAAVGRERPEEPEADEHAQAGGAAEHAAPDARRQAHVHHQLAAQHDGPLGQVLGAAGAGRAGRPDAGQEVRRGPDEVPHGPGPRA